MKDEAAIRELLGAYLTGDVAAEERAAVEQLLSRDSAAQAQAHNLRNCSAMLKRTAPSVSAETLAALRQRVTRMHAEHACAPDSACLIGASLTGDITPEEKAALERHLAANPASRQVLNELRALTPVLKHGELPVSAALAKTLALRLREKLPAAVFARGSGSQAATSARAAAHTLRVYATPNPWRARLAWSAAAIAALVALVLGVTRLIQPRNADDQKYAIQPDTPAPQTDIKPVPAPHIVQSHEPQAPPDTVVQAEQKQDLPQTNRDVAIPGPKIGAPRETENVAQIPAPRQVQPDSTVAKDSPRNVPQPREAVAAPSEVKGAPQQPLANQVPPRMPGNGGNPGVAQGGGNGRTGTGTGIAIGTNSVAQAQSTETTNKVPASVQPAVTPQPVAGMATVLVTRGGNVQARLPNGTTTVVAAGQTIPFGSQIITDQGRVAFLLPDASRLYVNAGSALLLQQVGATAQVVLGSGEIAFRTERGMLEVQSSGVKVTKAKNVDVKVADSQLHLWVLADSATLSNKGKSLSVAAKTKAVAPLFSADAPRKDVYGVDPEMWTYDLDDQTKAPASIKDNTLRSKARTRK